MNKTYCFKIDKRLKDKISAPIRNLYDVATILIETLQYLTYQTPSKKGDMMIVVHKMKRIFYIFPDKIFTFSFPFTLQEDGEMIQIYDGDTLLNNKLLSALITAIDQIGKAGTPNLSADFFEDIGYDFLPTEIEALKSAFVKIITNEYGYLRYDADAARASGNRHPYYHLDINYSQAATYKLGLPEAITYEWLKNLLDITLPCSYLTVN